MDKTLKMLMAGGAFALMAGYANAAMVATTASDISVRSGPGEDYPELGLATRGSNAVLDGCMEGSSWCRIEVNGLRGWAHADYLNVMYEGSPVVLEQRRSELSVPVVTYEKTSSVQAEPNPGDPNLGRVGDVDITPPEAVITYMDEHPADTVTFDGDVVVGTTLPSDTRLVEVPDYQYRYVRVNDVPVLVEPSTHRIVYVYQQNRPAFTKPYRWYPTNEERGLSALFSISGRPLRIPVAPAPAAYYPPQQKMIGGILPSGRIFGYVYRILAHRRMSAAEYEGTAVPPQSLKTAATRQTPALPKVDDGKIDFDTIEALFFAYRDFVSDPDVILSKLEYGRAHHRVVYFVSRQPGMTVADLLDTLQITKQSLARVLKQLIDDGYIRQMAGPEDRRQRRLYPTLTGRELALALSEPQSRRIDRALEGLGPEARACVRKFLAQMRSPVPGEGD